MLLAWSYHLNTFFLVREGRFLPVHFSHFESLGASHVLILFLLVLTQFLGGVAYASPAPRCYHHCFFEGWLQWTVRDGSSRSTFRVGCPVESDESVESGAFFSICFQVGCVR